MARGFYSPATYMAVKLVLDGLLLRVLSACIYGSLFYWIVGLRASASAFALFLGVLATFSALVSGGFRTVFSALVSGGSRTAFSALVSE